MSRSLVPIAASVRHYYFRLVTRANWSLLENCQNLPSKLSRQPPRPAIPDPVQDSMYKLVERVTRSFALMLPYSRLTLGSDVTEGTAGPAEGVHDGTDGLDRALE